MKDFSSPALLHFIDTCAARATSCPSTRDELAQEALIRVCQTGEYYQHLPPQDQERIHRRIVVNHILQLNRGWKRYKNHMRDAQDKIGQIRALLVPAEFKLLEINEVLNLIRAELTPFEAGVLDCLIAGDEFGEVLEKIDYGRTTLCKALAKIRGLIKKHFGGKDEHS